jgi:hypothetical protein
MLRRRSEHEQAVARAGREARGVQTAAGTQFTCFVGTKVQILTPEELQSQSHKPREQEVEGLKNFSTQVIEP